MKNLFEAIAEYMSAEGADARREHAKKVRIEFDLVQERMQGMQSRIEALEKDAARYRWLRKGANDEVAVVRGLGAMDYGMSVVVSTYLEEIDGDDLDAAIDTAMQSEKGGV